MGEREPTVRRRRTPVAWLAAVLLAAGALVSCGGEREAQTVEIVVPAGTQARLNAGESVDVMPEVIRMRVGDSMVIRNEDSVDQTVGPYFVAAGEQISFTYGTPGEFEGYCPLSEGQRYEIIVEA